MEEYLRTYCEIDLKAIRENYINIKKKTGDNAMTMAVIKADGYGHGAVEVAHYLNDIADYFGVATIDEGVELRKAGLKQPILLLGYNSPSLYYKNLEYGVDQTIYCYDTAKAMSEAAVKAEKTARIHIALDTGMTRIGLSPDEKGLAIVKQIAELPNIKIEGLFTHLSCADMTDKAYTESQMERYDHFVQLLDEAGIEIPVKHICNSAAIMEYEDHRYDMARAGIILYGMYPSDEVDFSNLDLTPAMSWYSHVVNIMEPEMERGVSYGATYIVEHPCRLATVYYIEYLLDKYGIEKDLLELEITETIENINANMMVKEAKKHGFTLLMDDFGSGYSSLNTLKSTPFDVLKIDRSFLSSFMESSRGQKIISHTIAMSHDIGLDLIAEGVETREQADFLSASGCNAAQGFYFSKPIPTDEFEMLLKAQIEKNK